MVELEFRSVTKCYDGTAVVSDVSFKLPPRRLCTILGPSGSGKSTLLRIAAGLEDATAGAVYLGERAVLSIARDQRPIAFLSQGELLFPHLDVLDNVAFGLRSSQLSVAEANRRSRAMLEMLGLVGYEARAPWQLSGGQAQRVALARALVLKPDVILLDEPLSNLDDQLKRRLMQEIRDLQHLLGLTVLYVTHDQKEAMAISDHIVLMHEGRFLQHGTPRDVYLNPASEYVGSCLGEATILTGLVSDDGRVRLGPLTIDGLAGASPARATVRLLVRPEAWQVVAVGAAGGLPGRVLRRAYLGRFAQYVVETDLGELLVTAACPETLHQIGAPVDLQLRIHGVKVLA